MISFQNIRVNKIRIESTGWKQLPDFQWEFEPLDHLHRNTCIKPIVKCVTVVFRLIAAVLTNQFPFLGSNHLTFSQIWHFWQRPKYTPLTVPMLMYQRESRFRDNPQEKKLICYGFIRISDHLTNLITCYTI